MNKHLFAVSAFALSLALSLSAVAQVATTSLRGLVKIEVARLSGAQITLTNGATGQTIKGTSNAAGEYTFPQIQPARYTIKVTAQGFGDQSKTAELLVNQPATIDFTMTLQSLSQVVNVSAAAETLEYHRCIAG